MIKIEHLSKAFNGQKVLDDVCLDVKREEILVVAGESGVGKSVLLKHIMGLLKPDAGTITIDGEDVTQMEERDLLKVREHIGYLFQEGALYDFMNVFDNISFPLKEHTSFDKTTIADKVKEILNFVDLKGVEKKFPSELSGGMKKRVALARAIILDSKILLCDEPTSGLDPIRSRDISDLIKTVSKKFKCTTIVTSHDITNSFRIADRMAIIKDAKIVALGNQEELEKFDNNFVQEFIN